MKTAVLYPTDDSHPAPISDSHLSQTFIDRGQKECKSILLFRDSYHLDISSYGNFSEIGYVSNHIISSFSRNLTSKKFPRILIYFLSLLFQEHSFIFTISCNN